MRDVGMVLRSWTSLAAWMVAAHVGAWSAAGEPGNTLSCTPSALQLQATWDEAQLVVSADQRDRTRSATYVSSNAQVATVDSAGRVAAIAPGAAEIVVRCDDQELRVPVAVAPGSARDFVRDVRPILNKAGCASAACHASQYGKGGFKLSVFGYDPQADFEAIARDSNMRRVHFAAPDYSLLLRKPSMGMAHGGGLRLPRGSRDYRVLRSWVEAGAPQPDDPVEVAALDVFPEQRVAAVGEGQQLRVTATYSDGSRRDVTALALYDSLDQAIVDADGKGWCRVLASGQTSVMIRYEGRAATALFASPYADQIELSGWRSLNFVDELAVAKFQELGLEPSPLCDDATFLRRAFVDAIGGTPTLEETRAFLDSTDPAKREQLVDALLGLTGDPSRDIYNDRYAAYWTLKWSDLVRNNSKDVGEQGMWALHNWIKESLRTNKPFDQFVRELVTAKGSIYSNGPANYFRIHRTSSDLTEATAQIFLGVRLECAKCHHHPFERYSQADYYGLAAFFARVASKNSEEFGIFGRETVITVRATGEVSHPKTRRRMAPTTLSGESQDNPLDRRLPLADWLTSPENPLFARAVANRYVGYLMGAGLVEPVDDMRATNPPSNPELLDALADHLVDRGFDLKQLLRAIMTSRLYQLSSQPTVANQNDRRFYSHYPVKRLAAEPLLDAVDRATGVRTKFRSLPLGTLAIELPDAEYPNYFLTTFAKPRRASVCECERSPHENLAQALHTLNGDTLATKIGDKQGRVARLLAAKTSHTEIVRELYLASLCRPPSEAELNYSQQLLEQSESPQQAYEDLLWALLNSKQFLFTR